VSPIRLPLVVLRAVLGFIVLIAVFPFFIGNQIYQRVSNELIYYRQYGAEWQQRFLEDQHVSVGQVNQQIIIGAGGIVVVVLLIVLIYRQAVPNNGGTGGRSRGRRRRSRSSSL